ncbi:maleylpyruvate isomerase family mycothiol-dependent enzyme [Nakamurella lactea]|uniref:maleylpyruvate isomerase family mycothiol-dependent enzyme n=1 Tax=Nakamurella lactea TaxID=459515 RepID=UPI000A00E49C|nr:maleylpyruvate isomerase family mycothiol-dependent enzyme [Nakamurella lactea]
MTHTPQRARDVLTHAQWMSLAEHEYRKVLALLPELGDEEWNRPTDCELWTVRDVVAHLIGAAEATASIREQIRQQRKGKARQGDRERMAAVNETQIQERESMSLVELRAALADAAARGVRARSRIPAPIRRLTVRFPAPLGAASFGYLLGPIYTRDCWMHRLDICRAVGRDPAPTAGHDGVIVGDLVSEWSVDNRRSVRLTGPAGGDFPATGAIGLDGVGLPTYDAIAFARALAGRATLPGIDPAVAMF